MKSFAEHLRTITYVKIYSVQFIYITRSLKSRFIQFSAIFFRFRQRGETSTDNQNRCEERISAQRRGFLYSRTAVEIHFEEESPQLQMGRHEAIFTLPGDWD